MAVTNQRSKRYGVLDPKTRLVHIARALAWSNEPNGDSIHATLCDEEVERSWKKYPEPVVTTCLICIAKED